VAYGKLLPKEILELPALGCVNIHGSLLPKYRGAAPVQHAVLNGETVTGVTSMYMAEAMDAGDIILKKQTSVGTDETAGELYDRLGALGAELLGETLSAIESGAAPRVQQNDAEATYAPPLTKEMARSTGIKRPRDSMPYTADSIHGRSRRRSSAVRR
jgi:methionyl-tRNA formyltransferase